MKNISKIIIMALCLPAIWTVSTVAAASFTAEMVTKQRGKIGTAKFYYLDGRYRMERFEEEKPVVVIADKKKKVHHVLDMNEKTFFDIASDDFSVLSMDPFAAAVYMTSSYSTSNEGTETVNGIKCEKQVVSTQGTRLMTQWFSRELGFAVKMIMHQGKQASVAELKKITNTDLQVALFSPPTHFKQVEEPGAAAKRKREEQKRKEEALAGITTTQKAQVPCYVKVAAGGELKVPVDKDRSVRVEVMNQIKGQSILSVFPYFNGKRVESIGVSPWKLEGRHSRRNREFNRDFWKNSNAFRVDELRIVVEKGLVYATVTQKGPNRKDFYNSGHLQNSTDTDPKRPLTVAITGDNPFGDKTSGTFWLSYAAGGQSEKIPFKVKNGETASYDYPAGRSIKNVNILIGLGEGRAKISVIQPADKKRADAKSLTVASASRSRKAPKPATVFTVTYPSGRSKGVSSKKDLTITVNGISDAASGEIYLYSDRKKTMTIGDLKFKLNKGKSEVFEFSRSKKIGWVAVWVYKGSFKVKLDQSPLGEKVTKQGKP